LLVVAAVFKEDEIKYTYDSFTPDYYTHFTAVLLTVGILCCHSIVSF